MFICALFAAGCSSGSDNAFVATPGAGGPAGPGGGAQGSGSVTFNFVRQQSAPIAVPASTVQLRFEFFTGQNGTGTIVKREVRDYANTITVENVPASVNSAVVTALTAEGFPLAEFTANINIDPDEDVTVDAGDGTLVAVTPTEVVPSPGVISLAEGASFNLGVTVVFSNDDRVPLTGDLSQFVSITSNNPSVVSVQPDGSLIAGSSGSATIEVTFLPNGPSIVVPVTVGDGQSPPPVVAELEIQTVEQQPLSLPVGTVSQPLTVLATMDTSGPQDVTDLVVFTSNNPDVSVNDGNQIAVSADAAPNTSATITATYMGKSDSVLVNINNATLQNLSVVPPSVSLAYGGFEQALVVTGTFSDTTSIQLNPADLTFIEAAGENGYKVVDGTVISEDDGSGVVTSDLTIRENLTADNVETTISVTVGYVTVDSLTITPDPVSMFPGEVQAFQVIANLTGPNGTSQVDISDFQALTVDTDDTNIVVSGKQVVAVSQGTATATFEIAGTTEDVLVVVEVETLSDIQVFFAGNELVGEEYSANLPRGYVGVVEVVGVFGEGENQFTRRLFPGEYQLLYGDVADNDPTLAERASWNLGDLETTTQGDPNRAVALRLFNESYTTVPVRARFVDEQPAPGTGGGVGANNDPWNSVTAVVDDLYNPDSVRTVAPVNPANPGSSNTTVRTRDSFRAIAADWRRGEVLDGDYIAADVTVGDPTYTDPGASLVSPAAQRFFVIDIDDNLIPTAPNDLDLRVLSVTVIDPDLVTFESAEFVNYPEDSYLSVNTVREVDVRVTFSQIGFGPDGPYKRNDFDWGTGGFATENLTNFRLAEANVNFGNGFQPVSTALGNSGVRAATTVGVPILYVGAEPIGGFNAVPVNIDPPEYEIGDDNVPNTDDDSFTGGTYDTSYDTFGPSFAPRMDTDVGLTPSTDPGPGPGYGQEAAARRGAEPADYVEYTMIGARGGKGVTVVQLDLFSIDPINPGDSGNPPDGGNALDIPVGTSQIFRTLVRFQGDPAGIKDRSLDYPPTLFVENDPANRSFVARRTSDGTGRLIVSGVAVNDHAVNASDIDEQVGNTILSTRPEVAASLTPPVRGLVIALDSVLEPINPVGTFTGAVLDMLGNAGQAQAVTTIDTDPDNPPTIND